MTDSNLNKEINEASERIEQRQVEINSEIQKLSNQINNYTNWAWRFVWFGAAVALFSIIYFFCKNIETGFALNLMGDFMAGTVASVWSLSGLFFIYVAFLGQKQQLLNQQLEIMYSQLEVKYTRLELAGQKAEMVEQNSTLRKQNFENTFFQLLANHNAIVNSLDLWRNRSTGREVLAKGRDCFVVFYNKLQGKLPKQPSYPIDKMLKYYEEFFLDNQSDLGHYFRNLYHIIKFVDESEMENKKRYTNFVRAQLSAGELLILFYNCLSTYGADKFKTLIERYSLLKNMDKRHVFDKEHLSLYDKNAYE